MPPAVRRSLPSCLLVLALSLGGCGNDDEPASGLSNIGGGTLKEFTTAEEDLSLRYPREWVARKGLPPQVAQVTTGGALVSIFAYPREDLGQDAAAVEEARQRLIESLRERAPEFLVLRTQLTEVDDAPAVEIRGRGTIDGKPVESRSVHVYKDEVEWVVDAYARPRQFERANRVGFGPLIESLRLADELTEPGEEEG